MIVALLRRRAPREAVPAPEPTRGADQREILAEIIDRALAQRAADRPARQAAARDREARKHHEAFARDPLVRALGTTITKGDHHV